MFFPQNNSPHFTLIKATAKIGLIFSIQTADGMITVSELKNNNHLQTVLLLLLFVYEWSGTE
jgi:hypothetical protein